MVIAMSNNSTANAHCDMSPRKGYCWRPSDRWFAKDCTFFQCRLSIWIPCTFFRPATPTLFSCNLEPVCYIFGDGPIIFSFFNVRLAPQFELGVPNPDAWCTWEIITCLHGGRPQRRPGGAHSGGRGAPTAEAGGRSLGHTSCLCPKQRRPLHQNQ